MASLLASLPVELLLQIHLQSVSSWFPLTNRHIHQSIAENSPQSYRIQWLVARLARDGYTLSCRNPKPAAFLTHALRFPLCTLDILKTLQDRCKSCFSDAAGAHLVRLAESMREKQTADSPSADSEQLEPPTTAQISAEAARLLDTSLRCHRPDIPKHVFRKLQACAVPSSRSRLSLPTSRASCLNFDTIDFPILRYMLVELHANPDSSKGYPLARAVLARHIPLIHLLLHHGADPSVRENMSVMLAIGRNDTEITRMLIEYTEPIVDVLDELVVCDSTTTAEGTACRRKRSLRDTSQKPRKKKRFTDRIDVTSAMLELAVKQKHEPLIQYFLAKGAVPNLRTLGMIQA